MSGSTAASIHMLKEIAKKREPLSFKVLGPYRLRVRREQYGRCIDEAVFRDFWSLHSALATQKGCYIFAMSKRAFYVGKATKSFKQEVFNPKNINTFQSVVRSETGKAALYLVALTRRKGKTPSNVIGQVEKLLIGMAHESNPGLRNVHHKNKEDRFAINGVYNSGQGKRSQSANQLRSVLRLTN